MAELMDRDENEETGRKCDDSDKQIHFDGMMRAGRPGPVRRLQTCAAEEHQRCANKPAQGNAPYSLS